MHPHQVTRPERTNAIGVLDQCWLFLVLSNESRHPIRAIVVEFFQILWWVLPVSVIPQLLIQVACVSVAVKPEVYAVVAASAYVWAQWIIGRLPQFCFTHYFQASMTWLASPLLSSSSVVTDLCSTPLTPSTTPLPVARPLVRANARIMPSCLGLALPFGSRI